MNTVAFCAIFKGLVEELYMLQPTALVIYLTEHAE